ncbi:hypothetical protein V8E36_002127 [Tilletia maclaganii]
MILSLHYTCSQGITCALCRADIAAQGCDNQHAPFHIDLEHTLICTNLLPHEPTTAPRKQQTPKTTILAPGVPALIPDDEILALFNEDLPPSTFPPAGMGACSVIPTVGDVDGRPHQHAPADPAPKGDLSDHAPAPHPRPRPMVTVSSAGRYQPTRTNSEPLRPHPPPTQPPVPTPEQLAAASVLEKVFEQARRKPPTPESDRLHKVFKMQTLRAVTRTQRRLRPWLFKPKEAFTFT